jgi:regulatory protein
MTTDTPVSASDIRRAAMNLLARREYSRAELVSRLQRRFGIGSPVDAVVAQLSSEGLQDDARFARSLVRSRRQQGKGPRRILQDLQAKGISGAAFLEDSLEDGQADPGANDTAAISWLEQARLVHDKRFGIDAPPDANEYGKRLRFLLYRGFDHATARKVIPSIRRIAGEIDTTE